MYFDSPYMNGFDKLVVAYGSLGNFINFNLIAVEKNLKRIKNGDYNVITEIGGYAYTSESKLDSVLKNGIKLSRKIETMEDTRISVFNLKYLNKFLAYCKENFVKVYFIRTPVHSTYAGLSNEDRFQELLRKDYSHIEFLDFSNFPLINSHFLDANHLNYKGARVFSMWFSNLIDKGLLESPNKQKIIDKSIADWRDYTFPDNCVPKD